MKTSWAKAAAIRAIKTGAQAAIAAIGTTATMVGQINWQVVLSTALLSMILSVLTSLGGLPEVSDKTETAVSEADLVNGMVTDTPTTKKDIAAEVEANKKAGEEV